MRYKVFKNAGLRLSELCLGAMTFGEKASTGADINEARKILSTYRNAGGNFIDTSNRYSFGESERIVGELIAGNRDEMVIGTKYSRSLSALDPNSSGNHRKNMVQSLEQSLKRLKTDYIDLYWLHIWDPYTPIEETMRALDDLIRAGKILYIGISNAPAWLITKANVTAQFKNWTQFLGIQVQYSLVTRDSERELLPMAEHLGLGVLGWGILGSGVLTGKYNNGSLGEGRRAEELNQISAKKLEIAQAVIDVAEEIDRLPSQVAINWIRQKNEQVIPLLGVRTLQQIELNIDCLDFQLDETHMHRLDEVSKIDLGYPPEFISSEETLHAVYGDTYSKIQKI